MLLNVVAMVGTRFEDMAERLPYIIDLDFIIPLDMHFDW
jgi:hypothetical protein